MISEEETSLAPFQSAEPARVRRPWIKRHIPSSGGGRAGLILATVAEVFAILLFLVVPPIIPAWLRLALAMLTGLAIYAVTGLILNGQEDSFDAESAADEAQGWRSQRHAWQAAFGLAGILALIPFLGAVGALRTAVAVALLLTPGYLLSLLLFPEPIAVLGRLILSFAFSACVVPLPLMALNAIGVGFSLASLLASLTTLILVLALAVVWRPARGRARRWMLAALGARAR